MYDHADLASNSTITFKGYIDSRRNKRRSGAYDTDDAQAE
jgi:hypothetical protein